jgi:hypothetical protein
MAVKTLDETHVRLTTSYRSGREGSLVNRKSPRSRIARSDGVSGKGPHSRSTS